MLDMIQVPISLSASCYIYDIKTFFAKQHPASIVPATADRN